MEIRISLFCLQDDVDFSGGKCDSDHPKFQDKKYRKRRFFFFYYYGLLTESLPDCVLPLPVLKSTQTCNGSAHSLFMTMFDISAVIYSHKKVTLVPFLFKDVLV